MAREGKKEVWWDCNQSQFLSVVGRLKQSGARLVTMSVLPGEEGEMKLEYFFDLEGTLCIIRTATEGRCASSLYSLFANADFVEREASNLFAIKFLGHPNLPRMGGRQP